MPANRAGRGDRIEHFGPLFPRCRQGWSVTRAPLLEVLHDLLDHEVDLLGVIGDGSQHEVLQPRLPQVVDAHVDAVDAPTALSRSAKSISLRRLHEFPRATFSIQGPDRLSCFSGATEATNQDGPCQPNREVNSGGFCCCPRPLFAAAGTPARRYVLARFFGTDLPDSVGSFPDLVF